jgi:hypothetical protein
MRELAYIQTIKSLTPIPGADAIEKAEVLGWELVVRRGEFQVGDRCIYIEIDSLVPEYPCFEFLRSKKHRVKTIKLRGQVSQGIAFPVSVINEIDPAFDISKLSIGQDVTEVLKIKKYESEPEEEIVEQVKKTWLENKLSYYKWKLLGIKPIKRGSFPNDIPRTEEIRVQKFSRELEERLGQDAYITEKMEGSSATFVFRKGGNWIAKLFGKDSSFQICSRNITVFNSETGKSRPHHLLGIAEKYDIHNKFKKLDRSLAIQGECIGPKIRGNIYKLPELEFKVFSIYDLNKKEYLGYPEFALLCAQLELPTVPILARTPIVGDASHYVELSKGKSQINKNILREGIVVRTVDSKFSFKSINPEYLLKNQL